MNSLYGKFGMNPTIPEYRLVDSISATRWEEDGWPEDFEEIGDQLLIQTSKTYNSQNELKYAKDKGQFYKMLKISTPIAIFTTAYARMHMAKFKIKYTNYLVYSDTDSLVLTCKLPEEEVGVKLGEFKLEAEVEEGVFLAPKAYAYKDKDGRLITKIKGSKLGGAAFSILDFYKLLSPNATTLSLPQDLWFRSLSDENIKIMQSFYTLSATENKREWVMEDGLIVNTKPFFLRSPS